MNEAPNNKREGFIFPNFEFFVDLWKFLMTFLPVCGNMWERAVQPERLICLRFAP